MSRLTLPKLTLFKEYITSRLHKDKYNYKLTAETASIYGNVFHFDIEDGCTLFHIYVNNGSVECTVTVAGTSRVILNNKKTDVEYFAYVFEEVMKD